MFQSAVFKLTAWYVGALLFVCLLFSIPSYTIASARLQRGAERQTEVIRRIPGAGISPALVPQLEIQRELQLAEDRHQLFNAFLVFNLAILATGSVASFWFARRTLRPLEEAHQAQVRFTADASHELRTPLANMQAEIDVVLRNKKSTASELREILGSNLEEIARLQQLSEQLLGLTKAKHTGAFQHINIAELIGDYVKEHKKKKVPPKITLRVPKKLMVRGDPLLLRQVCDILVVNAAKYANVKNPQATITLVQKGTNAQLTIVDNGPGIDQKDLPRIFDRFYRGGHKNNGSASGHGLGLALAKQIIEAHGGHISAHNSEDAGATFVISIPDSSHKTTT